MRLSHLALASLVAVAACDCQGGTDETVEFALAPAVPIVVPTGKPGSPAVKASDFASAGGSVKLTRGDATIRLTKCPSFQAAGQQFHYTAFLLAPDRTWLVAGDITLDSTGSGQVVFTGAAPAGGSDAGAAGDGGALPADRGMLDIPGALVCAVADGDAPGEPTPYTLLRGFQAGADAGQ